jgi:long-chain fatty acid transport protein
VAGLCALCAAAPALAGGLLAQEVGVVRNGTAGAGGAAAASDASTVFYNPAGLARLREAEAVVGTNLIFSDLQFDLDAQTTIGGGDGGNAGGFSPGPSAFYARPLMDDLTLGVGLTGLFGGEVDYDGNWAGRFFTTESAATALGLSIAAGYQLTERLSVGAAAVLGYMQFDLRVKLPSLTGSEGELEYDADDFEPGFVLGLLYELSERTRIGAAYVSEIEFDLSGDADVSNPPAPLLALGITEADVGTDIPLVQHARLSLYHEVDDSLAVMLDLGWDDWSDFRYSTLVGSRGRQLTIPRHWQDTWHVGLGLEKRIHERWLLQTGFSYDSSPVDDAEDGFPDLPMDRQWRLALGAIHDWSDELQVGFSYTYANLGSSPLDLRLGPGRLKGEYDRNQIHFLAAWVRF